MGSEIGIRAFSRLAGVTPPAIRKAIATGRVTEGANGIDPEDGTNAYFIEKAHFVKIGEMETRGEVAPGWAAVCVPFPGQHPKPIFYFTPSGETILASGTFFDSWRFDPDKWTAHDPKGKIHRLEIVTHPDAPPPWMKDEKKKPAKARR